MKKYLSLFLVVMLLLSSCSTSSIDSAGKELGDTINSLVDSNNKYVQMVKNGYRVDNPNITYDEAFAAFFGTPRWTYFESDEGKDVVEFTGDCTYREQPVKARIQFVVDEDEGTFEATYLAFNEVPQDMVTLIAVIEKAFMEVTGTEIPDESVEPDSSETAADAPASAGLPVGSAYDAEKLINDFFERNDLVYDYTLEENITESYIPPEECGYYEFNFYIKDLWYAFIYVDAYSGELSLYDEYDPEVPLQQWYEETWYPYLYG